MARPKLMRRYVESRLYAEPTVNMLSDKLIQLRTMQSEFAWLDKYVVGFL